MKLVIREMKRLTFLAALAMASVSVHAALPDWVPGKSAFEESRVADWNQKNASNYRLSFTRMSVDPSAMKQLVFSGAVQNSAAESIDSWILDLQLSDKSTNSVVLVRRVRFMWSAPASLNRKFEQVKFWMPYGDSQYQKIAASLGSNLGWNYKLVAAVPAQYKDYDLNKIFGVEHNEVWISHD